MNFDGNKYLKFLSFINLPCGHVMSHKKFGPDRFSRFDVYWIQTNKKTNRHPDRQAKFIYRYQCICLCICLWIYLCICLYNIYPYNHLCIYLSFMYLATYLFMFLRMLETYAYLNLTSVPIDHSWRSVRQRSSSTHFPVISTHIFA